MADLTSRAGRELVVLAAGLAVVAYALVGGPREGPRPVAEARPSGQRLVPAPLAAATRITPPSREPGSPWARVWSARVISDGDVPVAGAWAHADPGPFGRVSSAHAGVSDSEGHVDVDLGSAECPCRVIVRAPGYLPWRSDLLDTSALTVGVGRVSVRLSRGASIAGSVCDEDGRPIEGVRVACGRAFQRGAWPYAERELAGGSGGVAVTGPDGRFRVDGLEPGGEYEVVGAKDGWVRADPHPMPPVFAAGSAATASLTMTRLFTATIDVRTEDGASVTRQCDWGVDARGLRALTDRHDLGYADADLRFDVDAPLRYVLDPGSEDRGSPRLVVGARLAGYGEGEQSVTLVEDRAQRVVVTLTRQAGAPVLCPVRFRLATSSRAVAGRYVVRWRCEGGAQSSAALRVDESGEADEPVWVARGRCEVVGLRGTDRHNLCVDVSPATPFEAWTPERDARVELAVSIAGVTLEVRAPDASPARGWELYVRDRGGSWAGARQPWDRPPRAGVLLCSPGRHVIKVSLPGVGGAELLVDVPEACEDRVATATLTAGEDLDFRAIYDRHR